MKKPTGIKDCCGKRLVGVTYSHDMNTWMIVFEGGEFFVLGAGECSDCGVDGEITEETYINELRYSATELAWLGVISTEELDAFNKKLQKQKLENEAAQSVLDKRELERLAKKLGKKIR